jgi:hypothetical protein
VGIFTRTSATNTTPCNKARTFLRLRHLWTWMRSSNGDWRRGVRIAFTATTVVFFLNLAFVLTLLCLFVSKRATYDESGFLAVYSGKCSKSANLSTVFHIFINLASTIVLGSSSYSMVRMIYFLQDIFR